MIAVIAAVAQNGVIGREGKIPWHIPEDMKHFRELTTGHVVVMGRRTYEEIGHPLPDRMNYLISSTLRMDRPDCRTVHCLSEVLERERGRDIFICGGRMLYEEALPIADKIFLTQLSYPVEGDTFFPDWDTSKFTPVSREIVKRDNGDICFWEYEKIL